jgi:hypothetical protein
MASQGLLSKTAQFGLNSDWSSRNRCQPDLDVDLIFFALLPLDWQPKLNSQTLATTRMKLEGMNKT